MKTETLATIPAPGPTAGMPVAGGRAPEAASARRGLAFRRVRRVAGWAGTIVTVIAIVAWALLLRPGFLGGPADYVMVSGQSMEPGLHTGDFAITRSQETYDRGDVVAFRVPDGAGAGAVVIHRIVGGNSAEGFLTQGDNRTSADPWRTRPENIEGKLWLHVAGAGDVLAGLRAPLPMAVFAGALAFVLVVTAPRRVTDDQ